MVWSLQNALLLACDWQLDARTQLWQRECSSGRVSPEYMDVFAGDISSLKQLVVDAPVRI